MKPLEESVGQVLQSARVAHGLSRQALALELKLPVRHIEAIENDDWAALPPGRPRPLARQLAARLKVDLEFHSGALQGVPGGWEAAPPDPKQEHLERLVMAGLTAASVLVLLWLVVPGPSLGQKTTASRRMSLPRPLPPPPPPPSESAYPVLGELLPEAPINAQGILVSLRAMDVCTVTLESESEGAPGRQSRTLRVSEPWRLRAKGPLVLTLENAGVVNLEVAGQRIPHGQSVGEAWTGRFDEAGRWLRPAAPNLEVVPLPVEPGTEDEAPTDNENGTQP